MSKTISRTIYGLSLLIGGVLMLAIVYAAFRRSLLAGAGALTLTAPVSVLFAAALRLRLEAVLAVLRIEEKAAEIAEQLAVVAVNTNTGVEPPSTKEDS